MASAAEVLKGVRERVRLRVAEGHQQLTASIRLTRGTMRATRKLLIDVGLIEDQKTQRKARFIPFDVVWVGWWLVFVLGLILPTYPPEPFVVFPSVLALAIVWLFGMAQFTHTLVGSDLHELRLTPGGWTVLLESYKEVGIQLPPESMTAESAQAASKELESWLPGMARQAVLDLTSLAAVQAVVAGCIAIVGLLVGPSLSDLHWWHGWSPVSVLYAASLATGISLVGYGLVPFIVSRFLAALRLRSETATTPTASSTAPSTARAPIETLKARRTRAKQPPTPTDSRIH